MISFAAFRGGLVAMAGMALLWAGAAAAEQETRFQDWRMACEDKGPAAERDCIITQKAVNDKSGTDVLAVAVGFAKGAKVPSMAVKVARQVDASAPPLDPKKGLGLVIDRKAPHTTGFISCDEKVCLASAPLRDAFLLKDGKGVPLEPGKDVKGQEAPAGSDLLAELKGGKAMLFTFQLEGQDKRAGVPISLKGFAAAYKALVDKRTKKS
ncbi:MAG TPA: invasion associated locus B family protein [Azospirillaceae bacterium]|nr:invasion associated locus B family protein [Azospirillaceae bacterium]